MGATGPREGPSINEAGRPQDRELDLHSAPDARGRSSGLRKVKSKSLKLQVEIYVTSG